jgi:hypothetical protein
MKLLKCLTIAGLALTMNVPMAQAKETWTEISSTSDSTAFINASSIKEIKNGIRQVFKKTTFAAPRSTEDHVFDLVISLHQYDCANGREKGLQVTAYYNEAHVLTAPLNLDYEYVIPDTIGYFGLRFVCDYPLKKAVVRRKR